MKEMPHTAYPNPARARLKLPSRTMRLAVLSVLLIGLEGCGVFDLTDATEVLDGRWSSNVAAVAGDCCHLDLTLETDDGEVTGTGTVETPGPRIGVSEEFTIQVKGTVINDRIRLDLVSTNNPGVIEGVVDRTYGRGFDIVLRVNFEGFGFKGRDIILFPRTTS